MPQPGGMQIGGAATGENAMQRSRTGDKRAAGRVKEAKKTCARGANATEGEE